MEFIMRTLTITLKDLAQILRDRKSLIFLVLMPVVFTAFMGYALQAGNSGDQAAPLPLGWLNLDGDTPASAALREGLGNDPTIEIQDYSTQSITGLETLVKSGELAGAIVVPHGYAAAANTGQPLPLQLVADQNSSDYPAIQTAMRANLSDVLDSLEIARLTSAQGNPDQSPVFRNAWQTLQASDYTILNETPATAQSSSLSANAYNQSSPGMMVMFAIFGLTTSAMVLVNERQTNTLQRMLAGGVSTAETILGHTLAMFVLVFLQSVLLVALGQAVFKVDYLGSPLASLLSVAMLALWVSALGLLIGVIAKGPEQVTMYCMLAMFLLAALGGAMFPLDFAGAGFTLAGKLLPSKWAMAGFQDILLRGYSLAQVLPSLAIQAGFALLFLFLAVMTFRKARVIG
jgi:ABC-2 type transport system permease protein